MNKRKRILFIKRGKYNCVFVCGIFTGECRKVQSSPPYKRRRRSSTCNMELKSGLLNNDRGLILSKLY